PTIKVSVDTTDVFLHSKYDPIREVESWVNKYSKNLIITEKIVVIGLGAGHHIKHLNEALNPSHIQVIEFNRQFYKWFQQSPFHDDLRNSKNVSVDLFEELHEDETNDLFRNVHSENILIHEASLRLMPDQYNGIKLILNDILLKKKSIQSQEEHMRVNF